MGFPQRDPNASLTTGGAISRSFAYTVLAALVILAVMRQLFGSVRIGAEAGIK